MMMMRISTHQPQSHGAEPWSDSPVSATIVVMIYTELAAYSSCGKNGMKFRSSIYVYVGAKKAQVFLHHINRYTFVMEAKWLCR